MWLEISQQQKKEKETVLRWPKMALDRLDAIWHYARSSGSEGRMSRSFAIAALFLVLLARCGGERLPVYRLTEFADDTLALAAVQRAITKLGYEFKSGGDLDGSKAKGTRDERKAALEAYATEFARFHDKYKRNFVFEGGGVQMSLVDGLTYIGLTRERWDLMLEVVAKARDAAKRELAKL